MSPSSLTISTLWAVLGSLGNGGSLLEGKILGLTTETKYNFITQTVSHDQVCSKEQAIIKIKQGAGCV